LGFLIVLSLLVSNKERGIIIKRRTFPKIFFGWWTVLTSGLLSLWGHGYHTIGFSALFKPIASELGFSRAVTSVAAGIGRFGGGFEAPVTGLLTDRFGPKVIVLVGTFLLGLGLILMNFIDSLWAFYVIWGIIVGTGVNIALTLPLDKAIANWFVKKRGLALGIRMTSIGLATVAVLPLITWLVSTQGWRMTCVIGGVVMWLVGLPLIWFLVKQQRPEYYGLLPDGARVQADLREDTSRMIVVGVEYAAEVGEVEFTLRQTMRTPAYWLFTVASAGHQMVTSVIFIHVVPFLTDMGVSPMRAAGIIAIAGAISLPARFIGGSIADRVKKEHLRFIIGGAYLLQAAAIVAFLLNQTFTMAYVFLILWWLGHGGGLPVNPALVARYFGRKSFGSIRGISQMIATPFGVIGPIYAGWIYDTEGSYIAAFIVFTALLVFSATIMLFVTSSKPPAQVTDVDKIV